MNGLKKAKEAILESKDIVISGHINPDGDSIGSLLGLGLGLEKLGKRVHMISSEGVPERYEFLPGANRVKKKFNKKCDLAITVDCSNKEILGENYNSISKGKRILEIDHHEFRRPYGNIELMDHQASAVGEMIYALLTELGIDISERIAENLLTSIIVETNSFRLPTVRKATFDVCGQLVKIGVNYPELADKVYWSKTRQSVLLTGICLERCKFLKENKIAWSIVRKKDFKKVKGKDEDVDAVADEIRAIKDVKVVVLFREKERGKLRVSLRSKGRINVAGVAESFGGGGHFDVAGCTIENKDATIDKFLVSIENII